MYITFVFYFLRKSSEKFVGARHVLSNAQIESLVYVRRFRQLLWGKIRLRGCSEEKIEYLLAGLCRKL